MAVLATLAVCSIFILNVSLLAFLVINERRMHSVLRSLTHQILAISEQGHKEVHCSQDIRPSHDVPLFNQAIIKMSEDAKLTDREQEVFIQIGKGHNVQHVAEVLRVSMHTAKTHQSNIYRKFEVHSRQDLLNLIDATMHDELGESSQNRMIA
ncbi:MAG: LuxR C-terminal-related transcriptional regulator [Raoultibacter sp.]